MSQTEAYAANSPAPRLTDGRKKDDLKRGTPGSSCRHCYELVPGFGIYAVELAEQCATHDSECFPAIFLLAHNRFMRPHVIMLMCIEHAASSTVILRELAPHLHSDVGVGGTHPFSPSLPAEATTLLLRQTGPARIRTSRAELLLLRPQDDARIDCAAIALLRRNAIAG